MLPPATRHADLVLSNGRMGDWKDLPRGAVRKIRSPWNFRYHLRGLKRKKCSCHSSLAFSATAEGDQKGLTAIKENGWIKMTAGALKDSSQ